MERRAIVTAFEQALGAGDWRAWADTVRDIAARPAYTAARAAALVAAAKTPTARWRERLLATLLLEREVSLLAPEDPAWRAVLARLDVTPADPDAFVRELCGRLARLQYVHRLLDAPTPERVGAFATRARKACRLRLARYVFSPDEVADRVLASMHTTQGVPDIPRMQYRWVAEERRHLATKFAPQEQRILDRLQADGGTHFVRDDTSAEINALVEYPRGTVVMVVKPPGSDVEFEIKRTGLRGAQPVRIAYERDGKDLPPSHRFDGGSMGGALGWEADASAQLAYLFRRLHGRDAPISRVLRLTSLSEVPGPDGPRHLLAYLGEAAQYGADFAPMRRAVAQSIVAFAREHDSGEPTHACDASGIPGETARLLGQLAPCQALMVYTSSFRVDRIAADLAPGGARAYVRETHAPGPQAEKAFVDELLDEALGVFDDGGTPYRDQAQYVEDVFRLPANRARADAVFVDLHEQVGTFWGTLLATRTYTQGESLVPRNVGLKSHFDGTWRVNMIFMDHDSMNVMGQNAKNLRALHVLTGFRRDERRLLGYPDHARHEHPGLLAHLARIYRVDKRTRRHGEVRFRAALHAAYQATQQRIREAPAVAVLFRPEFQRRIGDFDALVRSLLDAPSTPAALDAWERDARLTLAEKGYAKQLVDEHCQALREHRDFLARYDFLFAEAPRDEARKVAVSGAPKPVGP